jgi:hypothetical protein
VIAAIVALAMIGAAVWFLVFREGPGAEHPVPDFAFDLKRVGGESVVGRADRRALRGVAGEVKEALDAMYVAAFLDPEKWAGGTYPEVVAAFTGRAAGRAGRDLQDLTLGDAHGQVDHMASGSGRLDVRFLVDADGQPFAASATTRFRAEGILLDGRELRVRHEGTYLLRPGDEGWGIVGYRVEGELEPREPAPTGTPT